MENKSVDWVDWHSPYSDPESPLSQRLRIVQDHIRSILLNRLNVPTKIISLCAGQGRDLLDVLEQSPELRNMQALLIENDPKNVQVALDRVQQLGLAKIDVSCADAGNSKSYVAATPANLVLLCGVFGNISDRDIFKTIEFLPKLCAADATVIWTRSRRSPDITPSIRHSFVANRFREEAFIAPEGEIFSVGVNTFEGIPEPIALNDQLFTFL